MGTVSGKWVVWCLLAVALVVVGIAVAWGFPHFAGAAAGSR
jgi:hypothetical protein